jgi:hypothetical protein
MTRARKKVEPQSREVHEETLMTPSRPENIILRALRDLAVQLARRAPMAAASFCAPG